MGGARNTVVGLLALAMLIAPGTAQATRIRDLCDVVGVRSNQLTGYGLVVGLNGTGDGQRAEMTPQSIAAMLQRMGVQVDRDQLRVRNVAAVMLTATLPPFAHTGSRIDVTVSSMGDASSLHGGVLLQTPLIGADRHVYAVAQGPLVVSGVSARGSSGSRSVRGVPTTARIPEGALIEREVPVELATEGALTFALRSADFTTASRIAAAINEDLGEGTATATNPGTVQITIPADWQERSVELVSRVEQLDVTPATGATVVINERTGTVVVGEAVTLSPCALAHGGLSIQVREGVGVSQPGAFATGGTTEVVRQSEVEVEQAPGDVHLLPQASSVGDLVEALNALGVAPADLVAIFQALHSSGALQARLEVQ